MTNDEILLLAREYRLPRNHGAWVDLGRPDRHISVRVDHPGRDGGLCANLLWVTEEGTHTSLGIWAGLRFDGEKGVQEWPAARVQRP